MKSRRQFFQAGSIALTALVSEAASAEAQRGEDLASKPRARRDLWNDLPNYMIEKVNSARRKRKADLAALKSQAQADERIAYIRAKTWELIGGKPDQTPLNAQATGTIERETYRIEKIIFEGQPEFYVTAHLYIPKFGKAPYPAVLAPVGHAPEGKSYRSYQILFQNLARQGFAVLAFDPPGQGERLQYLDPATNRSIYGPTGEHDRFGLPALLIGSTTTQFEAWDGIRALDYLLTRPEIDAQRIGCCGHSGGGTQTMFLCALEPRIHTAVCVEGHTENLAGANYQPPGAYADAEQNLIGGLKIPLDRGDLLAAFAPKPLLICYTPIDTGTTYSPTYVEGTEEIVSELKSMYGLYGAADKIALFASTLPHDFDYFQRRSTYNWFAKWFLNGKQAAEETAFEDAAESSLWCTPTGQVLTSIGGRAAFQVNHDRLRAIRSRSDREQRSKKDVRKDLREILNLPPETTPLNAVSISNEKHQDVIVEEIEYEAEPGIRVPGWFVKPSTGPSKLPVVLVIEEGERDRLFDQWPLIEQCARIGITVCSIDLRTCGATRPRLPATGPAFYGYGVEFAYSMVNLSIGSPIVGQQTWDLLRCVDYLESRSDVDVKRIGLYGTGTSGTACIAAATLDDRFCALLMNRTLVDLECIAASKEYELPMSAVAFGILKKFDLPDLCANFAPRPLWLVNTLGAQGKGIALSDVRERYGKALQAYVNAKQTENFAVRVQPGSMDATVSEWLKKSVL
jgi:cephalosporin-C deacetylase-like acetyl esterase